MKLSEMLKKYGDIEIDFEKVKTDLSSNLSLEEVEKELKSLSTELSVKLIKKLKTRGKVKISKKYDAFLIMDRLYNIYMIDGYNKFYSEIKNVPAFLANLIYYITDSNYDCANSSIKSIADLIYEEKDFEVLDEIKEYIDIL